MGAETDALLKNEKFELKPHLYFSNSNLLCSFTRYGQSITSYLSAYEIRVYYSIFIV